MFFSPMGAGGRGWTVGYPNFGRFVFSTKCVFCSILEVLQDWHAFVSAGPLRRPGRLQLLFPRRDCGQACCFAEVGLQVFCLRSQRSRSFFVGIVFHFFHLGFQLLHSNFCTPSNSKIAAFSHHLVKCRRFLVKFVDIRAQSVIK